MNMDDLDFISLQPQNPEPPRKRAKRADAVANREQILSTAQELFNEKGVPNVCMAEIAEAAKIGKGTLYRSFAHKGELCLALMDEDMRGFQNRTLQVFKDMAGSPALDLLDTFLDRLTHFMKFHAPLMREVQKHQDFQEDALPHRTSPQMWLPWLRDTIGILLQQAEHNGETENLDNPLLVDAILAPLSADVFIYQREVLGFDTERISRGVRRLVLYGCKTSPGQ
ncbi:MAG: TetR/AcrR family transcriptional regulator [Anaerolineae bacterium]|nr:TetR/AcrR family transcriptional regulator [Anaerolineae bacterium]